MAVALDNLCFLFKMIVKTSTLQRLIQSNGSLLHTFQRMQNKPIAHSA